eukprot:CAMPEP_0203885270 /NCGR_PEP_ID=MMETSP0359-20131031/29247_1 /ASSEMBLY_ACC=CAM_ASM_000338 /TAXON_ID=268821 /ORGANISM="Scrippsiella Hangoei, Strain SHTV-5" /LENGTH=208 /DNA_ID=CAMNT_0050805873 /DNA_START=231 /DNA_END=858 /DNA_ORIENTATION=+
MHLETAQLAAIRLQAQYFSDHIADTVWSVMIKIVPRPRNLENLQPLLGRGPDCNLSERREYNLVRCLALFPGYVHEARAPWQAQPTLDEAKCCGGSQAHRATKEPQQCRAMSQVHSDSGSFKASSIQASPVGGSGCSAQSSAQPSTSQDMRLPSKLKTATGSRGGAPSSAWTASPNSAKSSSLSTCCAAWSSSAEPLGSCMSASMSKQ